MQQFNINNKLDNFCNELENLSSLMVHSFTLGDYNIVKTIDSKRKLILEEISKDINTLSNSNKKKLKLIWVNNNKLIKTLYRLRDLGNSVIVVEHDEETIMAADYLIDIGIGAGTNGGKIVAVGKPNEVKKNKSDFTLISLNSFAHFQHNYWDEKN